MRVPQVALAQVDTVFPDEGTLSVVVKNLAMLSGIRVRVAQPNASAHTGSFSLPRRGDWGLIAFHQDHPASCVWVLTLTDLNWHSIPAEILAADPLAHVTYGEDGSQDIRFSNGDRETLLGDGTLLRVTHSKDGSLGNLDGRVKKTPRMVSEPQGENRDATRTPYTPPELPAADLVLQHSSGTVASITADGSVTVQTARGHTLRLYDATEKLRNIEGQVTSHPEENAGRVASKVELTTEHGHTLLMHDELNATYLLLQSAGGLSVRMDDPAKTVTVHGETVVVDANTIKLGSAGASRKVVLDGDIGIDPDGTNVTVKSSSTKLLGE